MDAEECRQCRREQYRLRRNRKEADTRRHTLKKKSGMYVTRRAAIAAEQRRLEMYVDSLDG